MTYAENIEDAPCDTCGKPVHLQHDAPQPCGTVICPDCPDHWCVECVDAIVAGKPTVIYDLPDEVYHAHRGSLSASGAKWLAPPNPCPAKFIWHRDNPVKKDVYDFGHVVHRMVLGAGADFEVIPYETRRSKAAQELDETLRGEGRVPITMPEYEHAQTVAKAVADDPLAGPLFTHGSPEVSLFWPDPETGITRRARLDWLRDKAEGKRRLIVDLKTGRSSDPYVFGKSAADFGYAIAAANYVDGVIACGLDDDPAFLFAVVEKDAPYVVTTLQADDDVIRLGRALMREALNLYAHCTETGQWPGYSSEIEPLNLPGYFVQRIEEMTA